MPHIDWDAEAGPKKAGVYHVEVSSSVEKVGRDSGDPYFFLTLIDVDDRSKVAHDVVSFSQNAMNMSIVKLKAMGFTQEKADIQADELVGRRCWIATKVEHQEGYEPRLVVDIAAKDGFRCGFKAEAQKTAPTPQVAKPDKELDDDIPF